MTTHPCGYEATKRVAAELPDSLRDVWLKVIKACYKVAGETGEFAKRWLPGFRHAPLSLTRLERYGILEQTDSVRGGHRAYWRMPDRGGVEKALKELGYL